MILSLALLLFAGLAFGAIFGLLKLPKILGMILAGVLLGPCVFNILDQSLLAISSDLRSIALIIILIKAGLTLDIADLKKVGLPAILMSFVPAVFEIAACVVFAPMLLGVDRIEAAIIGAVLGAVSPAVVVPRMVKLIEERWGTEACVPQLILAGASLDDVFVIVLFSAFVGLGQGTGLSVGTFAEIPVSIVLGLAGGALVGYLLVQFFEGCYRKGAKIRNSSKTVILTAVAFLLYATEKLLPIPFSGLLAVMSMACAVQMCGEKSVAKRLAQKFGKLWIAAEIALFVLVGAAVDIRYTVQAGGGAVVLILAALAIRSVGVCLCMFGTKLNTKERLFCVLSYLPKATVQAAIGSVPLTLGMSCGPIVLSVAVLSILITAPLGAIAMDATYKRLLKHEA